MPTEPDTVLVINAVSGLITVLTGLVTVIGGVYIAIKQHRMGIAIAASGKQRTEQIEDIKTEIKQRAEELKTVVRNGH